MEIEKVLMAHPSIKEAAVIGVPDEVQGEEIKACIVLQEGARLSAQELADYCHQRLARYKCPRYIQFYQQLPRSPMGRISKSKLREMSSSGARGS
jgi:acyl-coenzyme A synthetase/AMP-(fatty) acid ligase